MKIYYRNWILVGGLLLTAFLIWMDTKQSFGSPIKLEVSSLSPESILKKYQMPQNYPGYIEYYQKKGSSIYFSTARSTRPAIFRLDLVNGQIERYLDLNEHVVPFEIQLGSVNFLIHGESESLEIWLYDLKRRNFHVLSDGHYQSSFRIFEDQMFEYNHIPSKIGYWNWLGEAAILAHSVIDPISGGFYTKARNVALLTGDQYSDPPQMTMQYPSIYRSKAMPINAFLEVQGDVKKDSLYLSFSASPDVFVYDDYGDIEGEKIPMRSVNFGTYKPMHPSIVDISLEEMIHHYIQGYYSNFLVMEDEHVFVRFCTFLDPSFVRGNFASQAERTKAFTQSIRHSFIVYDRDKNERLGEYLLNNALLDPTVSFMFGQELYIQEYSELKEDEGSLVFRMIDLGLLLENVSAEGHQTF